MAVQRYTANLLIEGPPAHVASVSALLDQLWKRWAGWAVIRAIMDFPRKTVRIVPYSAADRQLKGGDNAYARPIAGVDAAPSGEARFQGGDDDSSTPRDDRFVQLAGLGTGLGSDAEVHFTAEVFPSIPKCSLQTNSGPCRPPWTAENRGADDFLLHELVHALRMIRGQLNQIPAWVKGYDNEEEFFAILIQNIYASEKGMRVLRADHTSAAMDRSLRTSEDFLGKGKGSSQMTMELLMNRYLVNKFVCQNFDLARNLDGRVNAEFNPVFEYLKHANQYPVGGAGLRHLSPGQWLG